MDRKTTPEGVEVLRRVGSDVLVVWDADDVGTDLNLRLALSVARALCVRERVAVSQEEASLEDESVETVANLIGALDEIVRAGHAIERRGEKVAGGRRRCGRRWSGRSRCCRGL
jgi:hypothetical protein